MTESEEMSRAIFAAQMLASLTGGKATTSEAKQAVIGEHHD